MLVSMYSFGFMAISYTRRSENATSDLSNPAGLFGANAPLHLAARRHAQAHNGRKVQPQFVVLSLEYSNISASAARRGTTSAKLISEILDLVLLIRKIELLS